MTWFLGGFALGLGICVLPDLGYIMVRSAVEQRTLETLGCWPELSAGGSSSNIRVLGISCSCSVKWAC